MTFGTPTTINFTDPTITGKVPFTINPNTSDGPLTPITASPDSTATHYHTSVILPGMGLPQYGGRIGGTIVHILENFASCTPPVAPTTGQTWYDYCNKLLKVYDVDTNSWSPVGGTGFPVAGVPEYNAIAANINKVIGPPSVDAYSLHGTWGYNQHIIPTVTVMPTDAQWATLQQAVINAGLHQGTDVSAVSTDTFTLPPFGATTSVASLLQRLSALETAVTNVMANRQNVNPATLETSIIPGGVSTRVTAWSNQVQHRLTVQFDTRDDMQAFFNAGGILSVSASLSDTSTPQNTRWSNLLANMGAIKIGAYTTTSNLGTNNIGYNDFINQTSIEMFTYNPDNRGGDAYSIWAGAAPGNPAGLSLAIFFKDDYSSNLSAGLVVHAYGTEVMTGTLTSSVTPSKPSALYLDNPELPFPTMTTTTPLSAG